MRLPWSKSEQYTQGPVKSSEPSDSNTPSSNEEPPPSNDIKSDEASALAPQTSQIVQDSSTPAPTLEIDEKQVRTVDDTATDEKHEPVERTVSAATTSSADGAPGEDDESQYPKPVQLYLLTFGLAMSTFVIALDNTIIATAIPRITTVFNSLDDVGWYGSSYLLTTTSLQPSFGKIYTYFNIKWTYIIAITIFEIGSVLCAAAQNSRMLIIGRAVAGVGAAAIFSGGMTIVGYSVPLRKRPIYIGLLSSMFGISSVIGPILGGALTDRVSWRWCFWINLPIGGIAIVAVFFFFKNPDRKHSKLTLKQKIQEMDLLGAFFLITAIVCLLLALQWGGITYPWRNSKIWGNLLGFALLISTFTAIQFWRGDKATLPPRIMLRQRTVCTCAFFSAFLAMGLYTHIYYSKPSLAFHSPFHASWHSYATTYIRSRNGPCCSPFPAPSVPTFLILHFLADMDSTLLLPSRQGHLSRRFRHPHHPLPRQQYPRRHRGRRRRHRDRLLRPLHLGRQRHLCRRFWTDLHLESPLRRLPLDRLPTHRRHRQRGMRATALHRYTSRVIEKGHADR